jgi:hypothetical protein
MLKLGCLIKTSSGNIGKIKGGTISNCRRYDMTRDEFKKIEEAINAEKRRIGEISSSYAILDEEWNRALNRSLMVLEWFIEEE